MSKTGRPKRFGPDDYGMLREVVAAHPLGTLEEITAAVIERTGRRVHSATVRKALRDAGVRRERPAIEPASQLSSTRYGYTDAHRRQEPE